MATSDIIVIPPGYFGDPINGPHTSRVLYNYTNQQDSIIATRIFKLWREQAKHITVPMAEWIIENNQIPETLLDFIYSSYLEFYQGYMSEQWEDSASVAMTGMIRDLEKFVGKDFGRTPKSYKLTFPIHVGEWKDFDPGFETDFPALAKRMNKWIDDEALLQAVQLTDRQIRTLKNVIKRDAVSRGYNGRDLAKSLERSIGLTEKMEIAVDNRRTALIDEGFTVGESRKLSNEYARTLKKRRALNIGRTEVSKAYNVANQETVQDAINKGVLRQAPAKKWYAALDERTCAICNELHGQLIGFNDEWVDINDNQTGEHPPAHVLCRCCVIYVMVKRKPPTV